MIEVDVALPILLAVASVARGFEFGAVRAGGTMASDAIGAQFLFVGVGRVADMAIEFSVATYQRKFGLGQVIVLHRMPFVIAMAIVALGSKAPGMRIVGLVATEAVFRNLDFKVAAAVATGAIDLGVMS